jgi:hypothetical protein|tara:strand:- start:250 stop:525 length:276 start_codon:yes stop_codon:yes gene_type:complete
MAKTEKVVDLKPTNISEDQLKSIQEVVSNINQIHMETGRVESQKHNLLHNLVEHQTKLQTIQKELEDEYGKVNINIQTGEINHDVETDKKD